jgi:hypothetical protein
MNRPNTWWKQQRALRLLELIQSFNPPSPIYTRPKREKQKSTGDPSVYSKHQRKKHGRL